MVSDFPLEKSDKRIGEGRGDPFSTRVTRRTLGIILRVFGAAV